MRCGEGLDCPEDEPLLLPGYMASEWKTAVGTVGNTTHIFFVDAYVVDAVYKCPAPRLCPGGDSGVCAEGFDTEAPACGQCLNGYYRELPAP